MKLYDDCGYFGFLRNEFDPESLCGENTELRDGRCVSVVDVTSDNASMCGENTELRDGRCVSTASSCGRGTVSGDGECIGIPSMRFANRGMQGCYVRDDDHLITCTDNASNADNFVIDFDSNLYKREDEGNLIPCHVASQGNPKQFVTCSAALTPSAGFSLTGGALMFGDKYCYLGTGPMQCNRGRLGGGERISVIQLNHS